MKTLKEHLEEDIKKFLDEIAYTSKVKKPIMFEEQTALFGVRDYEKEVKDALQTNDFIKAKIVYKDVKRAYGKLSRNSSKRKALDLVINNILSQLQTFAKTHGISLEEDEQIDSKDFEEKIKKNVDLALATGFEQQTQKLQEMQEKIYSARQQMPQQISSSILPPTIAFSASLNFPIDLPDLRDKQAREKILLEFKQQLELESEKEYEKQKQKYEKEKADLLRTIKEDLKKQNQTEMEKLEQKLIAKFGEKYVQFENSSPVKTIPKEVIETIPTSEEEPESKEDMMILEVIDKQVTLMKNLIKNQDLKQAKIIFDKIKFDLLKLHGYKKYKQKMYYVLKKIHSFLESENQSQPLTIEIPKKEIKEVIKPEPRIIQDLTKLNKKYIEGLAALKQKNKPLALKTFIELAKEYPQNKAIKIRLKEALTI